jgi:DNA polymerase alpha subunit A
MCSDEESCGQVTLNVSLWVLGEAGRGTVCPIILDAMVESVGNTKVDLYKQLTHFYRVLDASGALHKFSIEASARLATEVKMATVRHAFNSAA